MALGLRGAFRARQPRDGCRRRYRDASRHDRRPASTARARGRHLLPELGPFADHARRRGIDVLDELRELPARVRRRVRAGRARRLRPRRALPAGADASFASAATCSTSSRRRRSRESSTSIVVLSDRYARLRAGVRRQGPAVAAARAGGHRPPRPGRARSARARSAPSCSATIADRVQVVTDAWERHGIEVAQVGGASAAASTSRTALETADIVVAKSRAALDAMACGRAVYVYDTFGGDGWVTPAAYAALEADHFAGQGDRPRDRHGRARAGPRRLRPGHGDGQPRPRSPAPQRARSRDRVPGRGRRAARRRSGHRRRCASSRA